MQQLSTRAPAYFLRRSLLRAAGALAAEGAYSPLANERTVSLGADHGSAMARMVAFHEAFHAMLNGGTTFGTGMILAASLQAAGESRFGPLVGRMIESALTVHETYATLASVYAAGNGIYNRTILQEYGYYLGLFDAVEAEFELNRHPYVSSVCMESAARVAMQTVLLEDWMRVPCDLWPDTDWTDPQTPDTRFATLMREDVMGRASDAVLDAIRISREPLAQIAEGGLSDDAVRALLRQSSLVAQDAVNEAAFRVFAEEIRALGAPEPAFDGQRQQARDAIARVVAFAGDRLQTGFLVPDDAMADRDAVMIDFRRERLVLRPEGQICDLAWLSELPEGVAETFILSQEAYRYVQLVALPVEKLARMYTIRNGGHVVTGDDRVFTAMRRRLAATPARPAGLVEMVRLVEPLDIAAFKGGDRAAEVHAIVSASVLYETRWAATWLTREASRVDALAVLIDIDPFHLVEFLAKQSAVSLLRATLRWGEPGEPDLIEAIVLIADDRPDVVHFVPCSTALKDALADHILRSETNARLGGQLDERQSRILGLALTHAVREEPTFGFDFWK